MEAPAVALGVVTLAALGYWHWLHHIINSPTISGDRWYVQRFAFTDQPVSAPYCWRPLLPWMARIVGFTLVSYSAFAALPFVVYGYVGGGWAGFCCAMLFVGNHSIGQFNVRNPEYTEALGHLLFISSLWAMREESLWAIPLFLAAALCRETLTAALGLIAVFMEPMLLAPLIAGAFIARFARREDKDNHHPLVEATPYETVKRWAKYKGIGVLSYSHVFQPLRGTLLAVPFMWDRVGDFARLGLVGFVPIWLLSVPASGQSRIICYGLGLTIPFVAATEIPWVWVFAIATWFWPGDLCVFDETGGDSKFGFVR